MIFKISYLLSSSYTFPKGRRLEDYGPSGSTKLIQNLANIQESLPKASSILFCLVPLNGCILQGTKLVQYIYIYNYLVVTTGEEGFEPWMSWKYQEVPTQLSYKTLGN